MLGKQGRPSGCNGVRRLVGRRRSRSNSQEVNLKLAVQSPVRQYASQRQVYLLNQLVLRGQQCQSTLLMARLPEPGVSAIGWKSWCLTRNIAFLLARLDGNVGLDATNRASVHLTEYNEWPGGLINLTACCQAHRNYHLPAFCLVVPPTHFAFDA